MRIAQSCPPIQSVPMLRLIVFCFCDTGGAQQQGSNPYTMWQPARSAEDHVFAET